MGPKITLRPHHLDEIKRRLQYEKNPHVRYRWEHEVEEKYDIGFKLHVDGLMFDLFSEPDMQIKIVDGLDTICKECPIESRECKKTYRDTHTTIIKWPIVTIGQTYSSKDLIEKVRKYSEL